MKRDLAQLVVFVAWLVVLWRYAPLRNLVKATPRTQKAVVGVLLLGWTVAQVAVIRTALFPMISVDMYGRYTPQPTTSGVRIIGEFCAGGHRPINIRPLMPRPSVRGRVQQMYLGLGNARSEADSAGRLALLNETLIALGRLHNRRYPESPLCGVALDAITVTAKDDGPGDIPNPRPAYHVDLR